MNTEFLTIILGGGAAAMVTAIVQAYRSIKDGSRVQEKDAFADLEISRRRETRRREWAETERDYWHSWAATLEFTLRANVASNLVPERPPYPIRPKEEEDDESGTK